MRFSLSLHQARIICNAYRYFNTVRLFGFFGKLILKTNKRALSRYFLGGLYAKQFTE